MTPLDIVSSIEADCRHCGDPIYPASVETPDGRVPSGRWVHDETGSPVCDNAGLRSYATAETPLEVTA